MAKMLSLFKGSVGLNNKIDPVRLKFDPGSGVEELAVAVNVDVDSSKRVNRRKGYTLKLAKGAHSIFPCGGYCLFASSNALCVLEPNYAWSAIRNVTVGARVSYVRAGEKVYYANGHEIGVVKDRVSYVWSAGSYVGPDTVKTFSSPPVGHLLEIYNGMMLVAKENVLWFSEPFAFSWFDMARNYVQFNDRITMVRAVQRAVFVSTEREIYAHIGGAVKEFEQVLVADYPAIEGTDVAVPAARVGDGSVAGKAAMWASKKGVCFGSPDGQFRNVTASRLDYPSARFGSGLYNDGRYICLLEP